MCKIQFIDDKKNLGKKVYFKNQIEKNCKKKIFNGKFKKLFSSKIKI